MKRTILVLSLIAGAYTINIFNSGCAQISAPTGGPTDSLPPRLVKAVPEMNTINFTGNKISLTFDENIDLQELQGNVIISPLQKITPNITYNRKSVSIKFKDTLQSNTTYSIDFGNAIKDVHEGNILKNFTYIFSTGQTIDSLTLNGNVVLAETGKVDSTLSVLLYRNTNDTAVLKTRPDYIARVDGKGAFRFRYLPEKNFRLFALKDDDGGKTYNSKTELFAFYDTIINPVFNNKPLQLFAFSEQKPDNNKTITVLKSAADKKLKYSSTLSAQMQDLLQPFELSFNNPLQLFDTTRALLTDSNYNPISKYTSSIDSTRKKITIQTEWIPGTTYFYVLPKDAVQDSAGNNLFKTDTIRFNTKNSTDYGTITLRFTNLELAKNPVIQFTDGETIKFSYALKATEWSNKRFPPGEYSIRILFDRNNNGTWDPGNYLQKTQPEKVLSLDLKLAIKADWDNERDIKL